MGEIAEAMLDGDMSWDGEWLGDGQGFPRNSDGSPQFSDDEDLKKYQCDDCQKRFKTKESKEQHSGDKHKRGKARGKRTFFNNQK